MSIGIGCLSTDIRTKMIRCFPTDIRTKLGIFGLLFLLGVNWLAFYLVVMIPAKQKYDECVEPYEALVEGYSGWFYIFYEELLEARKTACREYYWDKEYPKILAFLILSIFFIVVSIVSLIVMLLIPSSSTQTQFVTQTAQPSSSQTQQDQSYTASFPNLVNNEP